MQAAVGELSSLLKAKFYLKEFILNTQYFMTPHHHTEGSCRQDFKLEGRWLWISILGKLMAEQGILGVTTR